MNTLINFSIASLVGTTVVSRVSNTFVQTGIELITFLKSGSHSSEMIKETIQKIEEMDIIIKIKLLKKIIEKCKGDVENSILDGVDEIISKCEKLQSKITEEIKSSENKWFGRYRIFDVSEDLKDLSKYNLILKNRIEMLMLNSESISHPEKNTV